MTHYDVFNGDADGICALQQLRLAEPRESTLITGVKRDIALVKQIEPADASSATILDISMDKNRDALLPLLQQGIPVTYADHHFPGEIPKQSSLTAHIDTDANTCTGLIINQVLEGAHLPWAITAAFGDNLHASANSAAKPLDLNSVQLAQLEELGTLLNYNGYGSALEDLYFPPDQLYLKVKPYSDPFEFIASDAAFTTLKEGYASDMQSALAIKPELQTTACALYIFPDNPFSRRVSGVYSNQLARENPDRAHALASRLPDGNFMISVRAPLNRKSGADELCRQFETGGGRKAAAGINLLPAAELQKFSDAFEAKFAT